MAESTIKRTEWQFSFSHDEMITAIEARIDFHTSRFGYWESEYDDAERDLKENGLNVQDVINLASNARTSSNYGTPVATLDEGKVKRFREAAAKKDQHADMMREFNRWHFTISHYSGDNPFLLTIADVEYFHLDEIATES